MKVRFGVFCREQKGQLDSFYHWWARHHAENPDEFPAELELGEWDEQFHMYNGETI